jgi:hypothetical protein
MKKFFSVTLATTLAFGLSACLSNTPIIDNTGDALTITGQVANYTQGARTLAGTTLVAVLGQGSIAADGRFTLTLPNGSSIQNQLFNKLGVDCPSVSVVPADVKGVFLLGIVSVQTGTNGISLIYATGTDSTATGFQREGYLYVDKTTTINGGGCDDSNFNLNLQKGWNKISNSYTYNQGVLSGTDFSSVAMPTSAKWFVAPIGSN